MASMGSAAPAGGAAPKKAAAFKEKKDEVEDFDMGGLFGGDDNY